MPTHELLHGNGEAAEYRLGIPLIEAGFEVLDPAPKIEIINKKIFLLNLKDYNNSDFTLIDETGAAVPDKYRGYVYNLDDPNKEPLSKWLLLEELANGFSVENLGENLGIQILSIDMNTMSAADNVIHPANGGDGSPTYTYENGEIFPDNSNIYNNEEGL